MSDTQFFDISEKTDVLLKSAFGFPSTDEGKAWYEETAIPFNNYINGEDIFVETIPSIPDFDTNGTVRTAAELNLNQSDFSNYSDNDADKSSCSIVDDSTGVVRRFQYIILEEVPQISSTGRSWYKVDNSGNNVIKDAFQFNYKRYTDDDGNVQSPYLYTVNTENTVSQPAKSLPSGSSGGNWFIDIKSGVLFFPDFGNLSSGDSDYNISSTSNPTNKPVLSIYVYVGDKGIDKLNITSSGSGGGSGSGSSSGGIIAESSGNLIVEGNVKVDGIISTNTNIFSPEANLTSIYQFDQSEMPEDLVNEIVVDNGFTVNSDMSLNGSIVTDVSMNKNLYVGGDASFNNNVFVEGEVVLNSALDVSSIIVNNDASFNGNISIGGDISLNGAFVTDITMNGGLTVEGDISLNGNVVTDITMELTAIKQF